MFNLVKTQLNLRRFLMTLIAGACVTAMPVSLLAERAHATGMRDLDANPEPAYVGKTVTLSVQLVDNNLKGAPLAGKPVTFWVKWNPSLALQPVGTAKTGRDGYAKTTVRVPDYALGPKERITHRPYTARFEGDSANGKHYHSGRTFTVTR